ncbi:MAG TPA: fibronectin type III domain-containing protein [Nitrosomonas sp.]|nr:fibronectin type III domain-containing protein [Nitrosomonas sp.]
MNTIKSESVKVICHASHLLFVEPDLTRAVTGTVQKTLNRHFFGQHLTKGMLLIAVVMVFTLPAEPVLAGKDKVDNDELPFKATSLIIETTDNDIELQAFVDGNAWKRLKIYGPNNRKVFDLKTQKNLGQQGLSEMHIASEPDHFPEDALAPSEEANEVVRAFLDRFPAGSYEVEGVTIDGIELEGYAILTHVIPALPEILTPLSFGDDPPVVDSNNLVIEWEPVTTRFIGDGSVEIIEYQVILDQVEPLREAPWIDGSARRSLINVPGTVTSLTVPPEYLLPGTLYDFEVLAIEASGNTTISEGEFITAE